MGDEAGTWPAVDMDTELTSLVRRLLAAGYTVRPIPLPGVDVQLSRVARGVVTVVLLAKYGRAIVSRHQALYDVSRPLEHAGQQLERLDLDSLSALRLLVDEAETRPLLIGGVLPTEEEVDESRAGCTPADSPSTPPSRSPAPIPPPRCSPSSTTTPG